MIDFFGVDPLRVISNFAPLAFIPLLFWKSDDFEWLHIPFFLAGILGISGIAILRMQGVAFIQTYPTFLIEYYGLEMLALYFYQSHFVNPMPSFLERVAMSFLIPYFASFFWEFPIHVVDFVANGLLTPSLLQLARIVPLFVILPRYSLKDKSLLKKMIGLTIIVTTIITVLELEALIPDSFSYISRVVNFAVTFEILFGGEILIRKTGSIRNGALK